MVDDEDEKRHERWVQVALCYGFNELVKQTAVLGEKVYFRLARDVAEKHLVELGGMRFIRDDESVATIDVGDRMPSVKFRATDIEAMRKAVADFDAAHKEDKHEPG